MPGLGEGAMAGGQTPRRLQPAADPASDAPGLLPEISPGGRDRAGSSGPVGLRGSASEEIERAASLGTCTSSTITSAPPKGTGKTMKRPGRIKRFVLNVAGSRIYITDPSILSLPLRNFLVTGDLAAKFPELHLGAFGAEDDSAVGMRSVVIRTPRRSVQRKPPVASTAVRQSQARNSI